MNYFKNMGVIFEKTKNELFAQNEIIELKKLLDPILEDERQDKIKNRIQNCDRGYKGEKKVRKKLKNCKGDMFVIYGLYFDFQINNYYVNTQIDYLLITQKNFYILECKDWKNDIGIDKFQNFYLIFPSEPSKRIASPFEQLGRQVETVRKLISKQNGSIWNKMVIRHIFRKNCKPVLVLTNDGERLYMDDEKTAKPVVHLDHLADYIHKTEKRTKNGVLFFIKRKILYSWVELFKSECKERPMYLDEYK